MSIEIGSYLKEARQKLGLTLEQLQEMTKIQKSFIVAIEKGEFQKLPSPFYVRTYLRSYANCVKVEPHHILRQYRKEEQAERGLTGAHKIIDESSLHEVRSLETKDTQISGVKNRVTTNMALTVAMRAQNNDILDKEQVSRELARRNAGYQGVGEAIIRSTKNGLDLTQMSLSRKKPLPSKVQEGWNHVDQEVSTWSSSNEPEVAEPSFPPRQATSKQTTLVSSGLEEGFASPPLTRSNTKGKKHSNLLAIVGMCVLILCGVGGLIYIIYTRA